MDHPYYEIPTKGCAYVDEIEVVGRKYLLVSGPRPFPHRSCLGMNSVGGNAKMLPPFDCEPELEPISSAASRLFLMPSAQSGLQRSLWPLAIIFSLADFSTVLAWAVTRTWTSTSVLVLTITAAAVTSAAVLSAFVGNRREIFALAKIFVATNFPIIFFSTNSLPGDLLAVRLALLTCEAVLIAVRIVDHSVHWLEAPRAKKNRS